MISPFAISFHSCRLLLILHLIWAIHTLPMGYTTQQQLVSFGNNSQMSSCNFNHNSSLVITAWSYGIQVWQYTGTYVLQQSILTNSVIYFGDFNSDSSRIAAGGYCFIDIWLYNNTSGVYEWNQHLSTESFIGDVITEIVFSNDSSIMIAACVDRSVIVWKYDNLTQKYYFSQKLIGHVGAVYSVSTKNTADIIVSGSEDSSIRVWTYNNVTGNYSLEQTIQTGNQVSEVDLSRDESMIVSAQQQSTLIIWTRPTNNSPFASSQTLNGHTSMVYTAKFNFDMSKIASTSLDLTMKIWSRQSNGSYVQTQSINNYMTYLNFDSNGILIANLFTAWKVDRAIIYSISVDCSLVDNSNGLQSSQGQCICNDLFVWDASYGCQIQCSKIANTVKTVDQNTCSCTDGYDWSSTLRTCYKKSLTVIIIIALGVALVLIIVAFIVYRYCRLRMQRINAEEAQREDFHLSTDQLKTIPDNIVDQSCSVCLQLETNVVSSCRHVFHRSCLVEWLGRTESCPNCRAPNFSVAIKCKKCCSFVLPIAFCGHHCRHYIAFDCIRNQTFEECIECRNCNS